MSGAIQKIDKSILDTARSDLSYAQNMIIILCILTGEVGMPSEKYIDFFYYSVSGQGLGLNRPGDTSKKEFNKALQELLDSGHCIETRGGLQFYEEMFTADDADKNRMKQADTFKEVLKELADKCDQAEDKCEQSDNCDRNEIDDMGVMQFVQAQEVKPVATVKPAVTVVSLPVYSYSVGDTLIIKGDGYHGKVEYTGSGWKILAGSICGNNGTNLYEEDGKFLIDLCKAGKVNPVTRKFNSEVTVDTFQQAHALLAHQYNETIDTFVCVYWRPPEQPELLTKILGSDDKIKRAFDRGNSKRLAEKFEIRIDQK